MLTKFNPPDLVEVFPEVVVRWVIRVDVWELRGADESRTSETGISDRQRSSLSFPFSNFSSKTAAFKVVLVYLKTIGIQLSNHGISTNSPRE